MRKRIAVLGTGANGSCTGGDLTQAGFDVSLIDQWPAHVEAMRSNGLTIQMKTGDIHIPDIKAFHLCDLATFSHRFDMVFLMVKAYDARWMAELIKPYLADNGLLIGAQNSMTADELGDIVGRNRTLGCVVELSSEIYDPGIIIRNSPPKGTWFALGALDTAMNHRVSEVEEVLKHVGKVDISDDIMSAKWMKIVVNSTTMSIKAMMGMTSSEIFQIDGVRELMLRAGEEALTAGQAQGYRRAPIFGLNQKEVEQSNQLLEMLMDKLNTDIGPTVINAMHQDHIKGRRTEIDYINGLVCEAGKKHNIPTPVNDIVVELNKRISAGELKQERQNLDRALAVLKV